MSLLTRHRRPPATAPATVPAARPAQNRGPWSGLDAPAAPRRSGPFGGGPRGAVLHSTLLGAALAAATWLSALAVVAVAQGRSALYPLAAVTAVFRGERALAGLDGSASPGAWTSVRGVFWTALVGLLLGGLFAVAARRARGVHPALVAVAGGLTGLVVALAAAALVGHPGVQTMQQQISSFEGLRRLGTGWVVGAWVVAGVALGSWWAPAGRRGSQVPEEVTPD